MPKLKKYKMPPPPVTNNDSINSKEMSSKTRAQVDKFHNQHVLGEYWSGKARNTVFEELPGAKVTKLRISGSTSACVGRDEGEYLYATVNPLHYKGTGQRDMGEEGEKLLGFVGHQVDRKKVAPVHLTGTATLLQDGHVEMDDDIYSQSQRIDID